ncbi:hypothetical protein Tco_0669966 [Tanacetum coccineum]
MEANEHMKNQVVELEHKINQGLRNRQAIIENLERQFKYLKKVQPTKSLPHTTDINPRHEIVYKTPLIRNENDKGNVKAIEAGKTKLIPTMPNPIHAILPNHVGDKELKSINGVRNGRMTKKEINKDDVGLPKEPNKEWKRNAKVMKEDEGKIVGIKRLFDDLRATAAKLMLLVYKLLLLVLKVNAASTKLTTAQRLRLLKEFLLSEKG